MREEPLTDFMDFEEIEPWLRKQRREVAVALAARAALRVLPVIWTARGGVFKGDFFADVVLPVFRATGGAWTAAKYPAQATKLEDYAASAVSAAAAAASLSASTASAAANAVGAATFAARATAAASARAADNDNDNVYAAAVGAATAA